jgi:hypothetical protein
VDVRPALKKARYRIDGNVVRMKCAFMSQWMQIVTDTWRNLVVSDEWLGE